MDAPTSVLGYAGTVRILEVIGVMAALTLVGWLLRRRFGLGGAAARRINDWVLNATLPVAIFTAMHAAPVDAGSLWAPLLTSVATVLVLVAAEGLGRVLRLERKARATFALAATFGNTGFIGYPVVVALFGEAWLPQAVLIDQIGPGAMAVTLGAYVAANASVSPQSRFAWREELRRVLLFPPLIALVVGATWRLLELPAAPRVLELPLQVFGAATVPLVMVAFGILLEAGALRSALGLAALVGLLRLVVSPVATLGLSAAAGLPPIPTAVATLQLAMPTMMFTLVLALRYELRPRLAAAFIFATMAASVVTLPLWVLALGAVLGG